MGQKASNRSWALLGTAACLLLCGHLPALSHPNVHSKGVALVSLAPVRDSRFSKPPFDARFMHTTLLLKGGERNAV